MSTNRPDVSLSSVLFGKTRQAVLALLYGHADEPFYLRQIGHVAGVGLGALQREVEKLSRAGILKRMEIGRHVYYQADPGCPVFDELKRLFMKTSGAGEVLRVALAPLSERIVAAFLYGSIARGAETRGSDIDIMVIGDVAFEEVVAALAPAQEKLRREVNPTVYGAAEFKRRLKSGDSFLRTVLKAEVVFLIGERYELGRLEEERLAR